MGQCLDKRSTHYVADRSSQPSLTPSRHQTDHNRYNNRTSNHNGSDDGRTNYSMTDGQSSTEAYEDTGGHISRDTVDGPTIPAHRHKKQLRRRDQETGRQLSSSSCTPSVPHSPPVHAATKPNTAVQTPLLEGNRGRSGTSHVDGGTEALLPPAIAFVDATTTPSQHVRDDERAQHPRHMAILQHHIDNASPLPVSPLLLATRTAVVIEEHKSSTSPHVSSSTSPDAPPLRVQHTLAPIQADNTNITTSVATAAVARVENKRSHESEQHVDVNCDNTAATIESGEEHKAMSAKLTKARPPPLASPPTTPLHLALHRHRSSLSVSPLRTPSHASLESGGEYSLTLTAEETAQVNSNAGLAVIARSGHIIYSKTIYLEQLHNCAVFLHGMLHRVQLAQCHNCFFFLGPTRTSVDLQDCDHCVVVTLCDQLHMQHCTNMLLSLHTTNRPTFVRCGQIGLGSLSGWYTYAEMAADMSAAGLSALVNHYSTVHDVAPRFSDSTPTNINPQGMKSISTSSSKPCRSFYYLDWWDVDMAVWHLLTDLLSRPVSATPTPTITTTTTNSVSDKAEVQRRVSRLHDNKPAVLLVDSLIAPQRQRHNTHTTTADNVGNGVQQEEEEDEIPSGCASPPHVASTQKKSREDMTSTIHTTTTTTTTNTNTTTSNSHTTQAFNSSTENRKPIDDENDEEDIDHDLDNEGSSIQFHSAMSLPASAYASSRHSNSARRGSHKSEAQAETLSPSIRDYPITVPFILPLHIPTTTKNNTITSSNSEEAAQMLREQVGQAIAYYRQRILTPATFGAAVLPQGFFMEGWQLRLWVVEAESSAGQALAMRVMRDIESARRAALLQFALTQSAAATLLDGAVSPALIASYAALAHSTMHDHDTHITTSTTTIAGSTSKEHPPASSSSTSTPSSHTPYYKLELSRRTSSVMLLNTAELHCSEFILEDYLAVCFYQLGNLCCTSSNKEQTRHVAQGKDGPKAHGVSPVAVQQSWTRRFLPSKKSRKTSTTGKANSESDEDAVAVGGGGGEAAAKNGKSDEKDKAQQPRMLSGPSSLLLPTKDSPANSAAAVVGSAASMHRMLGEALKRMADRRCVFLLSLVAPENNVANRRGGLTAREIFRPRVAPTTGLTQQTSHVGNAIVENTASSDSKANTSTLPSLSAASSQAVPTSPEKAAWDTSVLLDLTLPLHVVTVLQQQIFFLAQLRAQKTEKERKQL